MSSNYCKCWICLNTGPNGECEKCGKPPGPDRFALPEKSPETTDELLSEHTVYVEWLQSKDRERHKNWIVTYQVGFEAFCEVLQWENSNAKWYRFQPYECREEAGGYWQIWTEKGGRNAQIIHVRPLH